MFLQKQKDLSQNRYLLKTNCESEIATLLQFGQDYFGCLFPNSKIQVGGHLSAKRFTSRQIIRFKHKAIQEWTSKRLEESIHISQGEDYEENLEPFVLPVKIARLLLQTCLKIQALARDYSDIDYYFLHDVGTALSLKPSQVYGMIEQSNYEVRKEIFLTLRQQLTIEQKEICAYLLLKAIRADNKVHPAEIKYFEIVADLLDNNQARLENIEEDGNYLEQMLPITLSNDVAEFLFKYLVEIVMCDKDYDPEETHYIKEIAQSFGFDQMHQDSIIQPVTAALMVKADLFQK